MANEDYLANQSAANDEADAPGAPEESDAAGAPEDANVGVSSEQAQAERDQANADQQEHAGEQGNVVATSEHMPVPLATSTEEVDASTTHVSDVAIEPGTAGSSHDVVSGVGPVPREDDSPDYPHE